MFSVKTFRTNTIMRSNATDADFSCSTCAVYGAIVYLCGTTECDNFSINIQLYIALQKPLLEHFSHINFYTVFVFAKYKTHSYQITSHIYIFFSFTNLKELPVASSFLNSHDSLHPSSLIIIMVAIS